MRRTVWIILLVLLVSATVSQSVMLIERRNFDEFITERIEPDGQVVKIRALPPRFGNPPAVIARGDSGRKKSIAPTRSKPDLEDRNTIVWSAKIESLPKVRTDAYNDCLDQARNRLTHDLRLSHPPDREFMNKYVKVDHAEERGPSDSIIGETYVVKMDFELNREVWRELANFERGTRVRERITGLARVVGVLTIFLGCLAGYIRLDEYTKGYYTGRLRLVTIALGAVAAFGAAHIHI